MKYRQIYLLMVAIFTGSPLVASYTQRAVSRLGLLGQQARQQAARIPALSAAATQRLYSTTRVVPRLSQEALRVPPSRAFSSEYHWTSAKNAPDLFSYRYPELNEAKGQYYLNTVRRLRDLPTLKERVAKALEIFPHMFEEMHPELGSQKLPSVIDRALKQEEHLVLIRNSDSMRKLVSEGEQLSKNYDEADRKVNEIERLHLNFDDPQQVYEVTKKRLELTKLKKDRDQAGMKLRTNQRLISLELPLTEAIPQAEDLLQKDVHRYWNEIKLEKELKKQKMEREAFRQKQEEEQHKAEWPQRVEASKRILQQQDEFLARGHRKADRPYMQKAYEILKTWWYGNQQPT